MSYAEEDTCISYMRPSSRKSQPVRGEKKKKKEKEKRGENRKRNPKSCAWV